MKLVVFFILLILPSVLGQNFLQTGRSDFTAKSRERPTELEDFPDMERLNANLVSFSKNVKSLGATASSISSSILSALDVQDDMGDLMRYINGVLDGGDVSEGFEDVRVSAGSLMQNVASMGLALESMLKDGIITTGVVEQLNEGAEALSGDLNGMKLLNEVRVDKALENLSFFSASGGLQEGAEIIDDLAGEGISVDKVIRFIDRRGGFTIPLALPGGVGSVQIKKDAEIGKNNQGLGLSMKSKLPVAIGKVTSDLSTDYDLRTDGATDLRKVKGVTVSDVGGRHDFKLGKLGSGLTGFGEKKVIDASLKDMVAEVSKVDDFGGGVTLNGKLANFGYGYGGTSEAKGTADLKDLKAKMIINDRIKSGGGMNIGNLLDLRGGTSSVGKLDAEVDVKKATGKAGLSVNSGIGGKGGLGKNGELGSFGGGIGTALDVTGDVDLKKKADIRISTDSGTDGRLKLPGKLGGLSYDIKDITDIKGHVNFEDLSDLSLEILKKTGILLDIDLPGDELKNLKLGARLSIDTSKLGKLNVLSTGQDFANDVKKITEFNMLNEENLMKSLNSGLEFLARLHILHALRGEIGTITNMSEVLERVERVLVDMDTILTSLSIVKVFSRDVRDLGLSLQKFNIAELKVELPQLEALSLPKRENGEIQGLTGVDMLRDSAAQLQDAMASAIPKSAATFSNFHMGNFLDTDGVVKKINAVLGQSPEKTFRSGLRADVGKEGDTTGFFDMEKIVKSARGLGLDLNDARNIPMIMKEANVDPKTVIPFANLVAMAILQNVDMNSLYPSAQLKNLSLNSINDLSKLFGYNLLEMNILDKSGSADINRLIDRSLDKTDSTSDGGASGSGDLRKSISSELKKILDSDLAYDVASKTNEILRQAVGAKARMLRSHKMKSRDPK